jgi:hypothetical protein
MLKKLYVCVLEAKDLPIKNSRVKLQLGKFKYKTRLSRNTFNPIWNEEFVFKVKDIAEEVLVVTVVNDHSDDELKVINRDVVDFVGEVRIPVGSVGFDQNSNKQILPPTWFSLQCSNKSARFFNKFCGLFFSLNYLHWLILFCDHVVFDIMLLMNFKYCGLLELTEFITSVW